MITKLFYCLAECCFIVREPLHQRFLKCRSRVNKIVMAECHGTCKSLLKDAFFHGVIYQGETSIIYSNDNKYQECTLLNSQDNLQPTSSLYRLSSTK